MEASRPLQLLHLPEEILFTIFSFADVATLCKAILVCKHFSDLADPFLYNAITILNGRQGSALAASLLANPCRVTWVRSLLISTKFGEDEGLSGLPPFIAQMTNLENLRLETPDCNAKEPEERVGWVGLQDTYERIFEAASAQIPKCVGRLLPNLKTCTRT